MGARRPRGWNQAEWEYAAHCAESRIPMFGLELTAEQVASRLRGILEICPEFYPAQLELALRILSAGRNKRAEQEILRGFETLLRFEKPDAVEESVDSLIDNLERLRRFDLSRRVLQRMVNQCPDNAGFHDSLAHAEVRLGNVQEALRHASRADELEPANSFYKSNHGWFLLMGGKAKEARPLLREALHLDPDNEAARNNMTVCEHMLDSGGTYLDYLLRPADSAELDRLADAEEWDDVNELCASYNSGKLEAMELCRLQEAGNDRALLADNLATLRTFFGFLENLCADGYLLYENLEFVADRFEAIMHKFIFKFGDVDRDLIEDIYGSLFDYYGFLADRGLVSKGDVARFRKKSLSLKRGLIGKMARYNEVRHDDRLDEEEKDGIRAELFGSDAFYPHL